MFDDGGDSDQDERPFGSDPLSGGFNIGDLADDMDELDFQQPSTEFQRSEENAEDMDELDFQQPSAELHPSGEEPEDRDEPNFQQPKAEFQQPEEDASSWQPPGSSHPLGGGDDAALEEGDLQSAPAPNTVQVAESDAENHQTVGGPSYDDLIAPPPSYAETMMPPPSYADSVHMSSSALPTSEIEQDMEGISAEEETEITQDPDLGRSRCFSNAKGVLDITVTDPIKHDDEGSSFAVVGKKYWDYQVTTVTSLPGFSRPKFNVRRRFKDFVLLSECLSDSHRGYFIPLHPEKSFGLAGQLAADKEFVEERRASLQKYLERLVSHPVLLHSAELRAFLEFEGNYAAAPALKAKEGSIISSAARLPKQMFGSEPAVPAPAEVAQPAKASRDFMRMFKELKQSITQSSAIGGAQSTSSVEDDQYLKKNVMAMLTELERQLSTSSNNAENMVMKAQNVGDVMGELGMVFIKLANFEDGEANRRGNYSEDGASLADMASDLRRIGRACVRLSRLSRAASAQMVTQLAPLHEYLAMQNAVKKAMAHRTDALLTAQTLEAEVASKKQRITRLDEQRAKVFGGDKARQRKIDELTREVEAAEASHGAALEEFERIKGRNKDEWDRYTQERSSDLISMLQGTARVQASYNERSYAIWMQVAEELGATQDDL